MVETLEALTYPSTRFALSLVRSIASDYRASRELPKLVSARARALHARGLANVNMMNQGEQNLLDDLREIDDSGSFVEFSSQSLYAYAVEWLGLTSSVALNLIAIMRRGKQVPELVQAIKDGRINISAARKITPVIDAGNKDAWLELASTSTVAAVEKAVATASPKHAVQESLRYITGERLEMKLGVSEEFRDVLKELKNVLSQKARSSVDSEEAILFAMKDCIARYSPLEKAKRARVREEKKTASEESTKVPPQSQSLAGLHSQDLNGLGDKVRNLVEPCIAKVDTAGSATPAKDSAASIGLQVVKRTPLSAVTKHFVISRDGGRCTVTDANGVRCAQTRWLDTHHVVEVSNGGDNSPENLRTVCSGHHRQIHADAYVM